MGVKRLQKSMPLDIILKDINKFGKIMNNIITLQEFFSITEAKDGEAEILINEEWLVAKNPTLQEREEIINSLLTLMKNQVLEDFKNTPKEIKLPRAKEAYIFTIAIAGGSFGQYKVFTKFGEKAREDITLLDGLAHVLKSIAVIQEKL